MDDDLVEKLCDAVRDTATANGVDDNKLHSIIDSVVDEVRTNITEYVDIVVNKKRWF